MAWVTKRAGPKGNSWQVGWRDDSGKRHFESFETEGGAKGKKAEVENRQLNRGEDVAPSTVTLREYVDLEGDEGWFARAELKGSTRRAWKKRLELNVLPALVDKKAPLGDKKLKKITRPMIKTLARKTREGGHARTTVRGFLNLLHHIFADAVENGVIQGNPCSRVKVPKVAEDRKPRDERPPKRNEIILETEAQIETYVAKATELYPPSEEMWGVFMVLAVYSGLREGELCGLKWADLNLTGETPRLSVERSWDREEGAVEPKSEAGYRNVPILPEARKVLLEWKLASSKAKAGDRVFPVRPQSYRKHHKKVLKALRAADEAFPVISGVQALRHTYETAMARRGVVPKKLQGWMGHSTIQMTLDLYARVTSEGDDRELEKLAGFGGL